MRLVHGAIAVAMIGALTACGSSDGPESASPSSAATNSACSLLGAADRQKLAGVAVDDEVTVEGPTADYSCRWSDGGDALVNVISTPSTVWAEDAPDVIDQLRSKAASVGAKYKDEIDRAVKLLEGDVPATSNQACELFVAIARVNGALTGEGESLGAVEITPGLTALSVQTCLDGRFASVTVASPDVKQSDETAALLRDAVAKVRQASH